MFIKKIVAVFILTAVIWGFSAAVARADIVIILPTEIDIVQWQEIFPDD